MNKDSHILLDYYVNYNAIPISLNLWESEMYYAAVPVQQMVGNLVYYSNFGRYELRLAESWKRVSENIWKIKLRAGAVCENGESITSASFVKSLERSLYIMSKHGHTPVLKNLIGYHQFISENDKNIFNLTPLNGLKIIDDEIVFTFNKPIRDGLLQILSFAPYGYICADNLNPDGSWKNNKNFISSGPYKLKQYMGFLVAWKIGLLLKENFWNTKTIWLKIIQKLNSQTQCIHLKKTL